MTIGGYIQERLYSLGYASCGADLADMGIEDAEAELTPESRAAAYRAFVKFVPQLLLRPASVSEGGASISRAQRADIEAWYRQEAKRLGIADGLSPKVRFI